MISGKVFRSSTLREGAIFYATPARRSNGVRGFLNLLEVHHRLHPSLINPSDARAYAGGYGDYPELYTRWYEYGVFELIFRMHGTCTYNEICSYGTQAAPFLAKYPRLRYELLPYFYPLSYCTYSTGKPCMRTLLMDFPDDPEVASIDDEYTFGPAFLVTPFTDRGATSGSVYLPRAVSGATTGRTNAFMAARPFAPMSRLIPSLSLFAPVLFFRLAGRSRMLARSKTSWRSASVPEPMGLLAIQRRRENLRPRKRGYSNHSHALSRCLWRVYSRRSGVVDRSRWLFN